MANDPMTVNSAKEITIRDGVHMVSLLVSGPADYDAANGSALDVSAYVTTIDFISFGACTAAVDNLVVPRYVNDDLDDADGGAVFFTWQGDTAIDAVFENVADTTSLAAYQWQVLLVGTPA